MDAGSLVSPVLRGPFTGRARREVAFCVLTLPFGVFIPLAGFFATVDAGLLLGSGPPWVADGNPSGQAVAAAAGVAALLTVLLVMTGAVRRLTGSSMPHSAIEPRCETNPSRVISASQS